LADHFQFAQYCILSHPLAKECLAASAAVTCYVPQGFADVFEVETIVIHKEAASARICC
jgi:hypothetical protein